MLILSLIRWFLLGARQVYLGMSWTCSLRRSASLWIMRLFQLVKLGGWWKFGWLQRVCRLRHQICFVVGGRDGPCGLSFSFGRASGCQACVGFAHGSTIWRSFGCRYIIGYTCLPWKVVGFVRRSLSDIRTLPLCQIPWCRLLYAIHRCLGLANIRRQELHFLSGIQVGWWLQALLATCGREIVFRGWWLISLVGFGLNVWVLKSSSSRSFVLLALDWASIRADQHHGAAQCATCHQLLAFIVKVDFRAFSHVKRWHAWINLWFNIQISAFSQTCVKHQLRIQTYEREFVVDCLLVCIIYAMNNFLTQLWIQTIELNKHILALLPHISIGVSNAVLQIVGKVVLKFVQKLTWVSLQHK